VTAAWHGDSDAIAREEAVIRAIQDKRTSNFVANPRAQWSAIA
jgi:hypothetical protein